MTLFGVALAAGLVFNGSFELGTAGLSCTRTLSVVGRDADTRETFWRQDFAVTLAAGETRTVAVDVPIWAFGPW